jgi:hypothetical protein
VTEQTERDVRALLAGLDAGPLPQLDVDAVMRGGRRYRRRQVAYRSVVSLAVVLVAVGVVAEVIRLSGGPAPRPVNSPTPTSSPGPTGSPSARGSAAPSAASFTATGSMDTARPYATATLLRDGKVLVAGGMEGWNPGHAVAAAQLYDPTTGQYTPTGSMTTPRIGAMATLLPDGEVLIAGGSNANGSLKSAELYDPATGRFTATGSMPSPRILATVTLLPDGDVLIAGGLDGVPDPNSDLHLPATALLYEPFTGTFTATGSLHSPREDATATLLGGGRVLIAGGNAPYGPPVLSAELYDPATGTFTPTGSLHVPRSYATATLLGDGQALIAGGDGWLPQGGGSTWSSAELYDPATGTFTPTGPMTAARMDATATLLPDGRVLVAGGDRDMGPNLGIGSHPLASAELYDPATGTFTPTASMTTARAQATATALLDGRVLIAGGTNDIGGLSSAELYQPDTDLTPSEPRPAAGTIADLSDTAQLQQQIRDSYYQAYLADRDPQDIFGPAGQPERAVLLRYISHAGVVYGSTPAQNDYWVVADICLANPTSGCQDGGTVQVFHRVGPTGLYSYHLLTGVCSIPAPLLQRWYPGGLLPAGIRCPQPSFPASPTPAG